MSGYIAAALKALAFLAPLALEAMGAIPPVDPELRAAKEAAYAKKRWWYFRRLLRKEKVRKKTRERTLQRIKGNLRYWAERMERAGEDPSLEEEIFRETLRQSLLEK